MTFEMQVVSNTPLIGDEDLDSAAKKFFEQIGYLSKGSDPAIPYKIFADFFLKHPTKAWIVDEIAAELKTSRPTVYRHLNKLKSMDILEEVKLEDEITAKDGKKMIQVKKGYKLRYSNLSKAWTFVEAHVEAAMDNYRKTIDHLQSTLEKEKKMVAKK